MVKRPDVEWIDLVRDLVVGELVQLFARLEVPRSASLEYDSRRCLHGVSARLDAVADLDFAWQSCQRSREDGIAMAAHLPADDGSRTIVPLSVVRVSTIAFRRSVVPLLKRLNNFRNN